MKRQSRLKCSAQPAQPLPACPAPITTASERARAAPEAPAQWSRPLPHEGREDPLAAVTDPLPQGVKPRNAQLPVLPARLNPLLLSRVRWKTGKGNKHPAPKRAELRKERRRLPHTRYFPFSPQRTEMTARSPSAGGARGGLCPSVSRGGCALPQGEHRTQ